MKKALFLLFFVSVPVSSVHKTKSTCGTASTEWQTDIDSQSDTSTYTANWEVVDYSIWDSYGDGWLKQYRYDLFEDGQLHFTTYEPEAALVKRFSSTVLSRSRTSEDLDQSLEPGSTLPSPGHRDSPSTEGNPDQMEEVGWGESDGVTIEGGEEPPEEDPPEEDPPEEEPVVVRPRGGTVSLSARPSSLRFASDESEASVTLSVAAGGAGEVELTSIREDRTYPGWGEKTGSAERLDLTVAGGFALTVRRTVSLSALDRAKALGSATEGSFTVTYFVQGRDTWGNPVSASLDVPVEVSGGMRSSLAVQGVSVELPASPYYLGESVVGSQITVEASGSGTVTGQVKVDDSLDWSGEPSFAVSIAGTTTFPIPGALPVEEPGLHTVRVELTSPKELSCESVYEVSASEAPFPPQTLTLVPGVAELADFGEGEATVTDDGNGGLVYTVNASASLRLLSLDGQVVPGAVVNGLEVRYPAGDAQAAEIVAGTVVAEGGDEALASFADGYLELNRIAFDRAQDSPQLTARATVTVPQLGADVAIVEGVAIGEAGVEVGAYPWEQAVPLDFEAFGFEFGLDAVEGYEADARYAFSLSGGVGWQQNTAGDVATHEILDFSGLTFFSDGSMEGALGVSQPYELVPGVLTVTHAGLALEDGELSFALGGSLGGLPEPLDVMETAFTLVFDTGGNVESGIVLVDELTTGERGKGGDDESEWGDEFPIATLDVTYLAIDLIVSGGVLHRGQSRVQVGVDVYLDLLSGDDEASDRIGFGSISGENGFTDGLEISFDGDVHWPAPDAQVNLVSGKSLDYGPVTATLDNLALCFDDGFAFVFSGSFGLAIEQIEGAISFTDLEVSLSGVKGAPDIAQTQLAIMDFVAVSVGEVAWGSGEIAFYEDQTSGEGVDRTPARSEEPVTITVDNYFRIDGAEINIGSGRFLDVQRRILAASLLLGRRGRHLHSQRGERRGLRVRALRGHQIRPHLPPRRRRGDDAADRSEGRGQDRDDPGYRGRRHGRAAGGPTHLWPLRPRWRARHPGRPVGVSRRGRRRCVHQPHRRGHRHGARARGVRPSGARRGDRLHAACRRRRPGRFLGDVARRGLRRRAHARPG